MAEISFAVPPGPLSLEGGAAYVRQMAAALSQAGHVVHLDGRAAPIRVIDGAALPSLSPEQSVGAIGLVHHTTPLAAEGDWVAARRAERERLALLGHIIVTSNPVRDRLAADYAVDPARMTVVAPGVPDAPRSTGSGGPECAVLSIGALTPRKGHDVLIRALSRLFDLPWRLTIVGDDRRDPAHAAALRAQAASAGAVQFAGPLDGEALEAAWRTADLFALATEWEGFCAPAAEALRRGLPVAITNGGAAAEWVTPEAGVVCTPGDADGLSKAMRRVVFDQALRREMADAAWQIGRTLPGWPAQAARFMEACQCC